MEGWIKLHRSCRDHWLYTEYRPLTRREAWENILLSVNYEPKKTLIKGKVYECGVGQSLLSLESWAKEFVWSVQQVRTFFKLLEADGMIKTEGLQYTTRLTICNWDTYQGVVTSQKQADNKPLTDGQQTANRPLTTTKEGKEREESKEYKEEILPISEFYPFEEFWKDYDKKVGKKENLEAKWKKVSKADRILIKEYLPKYKLAQPDKKFRKNPDTFLNNRSWNDEIIDSKPIQKPAYQPAKNVNDKWRD